MLQAVDKTEEWYLVFTEAKFDHWIWRIVDRDMGHVYAVKDLNPSQWLVIQPRVNIVEVRILLKCKYPVIRAMTNPEDKVLKVVAKAQNKARGTLNWFNCVEQVKALVGINSFWTFTPKQLYKGLIGGRYG